MPIDNSDRENQMILLKQLVALFEKGGKLFGKPGPPRISEAYLSWVAAGVLESAQCFIILREAGKKHGSKAHVRPIIELVFKAVASYNDPSALFRIAYAEWKQDRKSLRRDSNGLKVSDRQLADLKARFARDFPGIRLITKSITIRDLSKIADLESSYNSVFSVYSEHTHESLRALTGNYDDVLDRHDLRVVLSFLTKLLETIESASGSQLDTFPELKAKILEILTKEPV